MLAISDGHGSPANFRSDVGSKCATSAAVEVMYNFQKNCQDYDLKKLTEVVHQRIPQELVRNWRRKVIAHWESNPFRKEEFQRLEMRDGEEAVQYVNSQPILAYGATVLGVLITDSFILYLQLGDGDILCVMSKGNIVTPIEKDRRLIANETTSLCTEDAWKDFRVHFAPLREGVIPSLILLSTDGYSNSFKTNADFLQIGTDYLSIINEEGFEQVTKRLSFILEESSREGSGDDITLGMIYQLPEYSQRSLAYLSTVQSSTASTRIETRQHEEARVSITAENKTISNHRDRQLGVRDSFWKFGIRINIGIFLISLISLVVALFLLNRSEPTKIKTSSSSKVIVTSKETDKQLESKQSLDLTQIIVNEIDTTYRYLLKKEFLVSKKNLSKSNIKQFIESQPHPYNNKWQTKNFIQSINHILLEVNELNRVRSCLKAPEASEIESCLNRKQPSSNVTNQGHSKNPGSHTPDPSPTGKREPKVMQLTG
jgi:hypothetical protein